MKPKFANGTAANLTEAIRSALDEDRFGAKTDDRGKWAEALFACDGKTWLVVVTEQDEKEGGDGR